MRASRHRVRRILTPGDERGVTLVTAALTLFVLIGFSAIAVDGSNLYRERGDAQNAADLAAMAAAYEECTGASEADAILAGEFQATQNGYDSSDPNVTVIVVKEDPNWRATIDTTINGFFSKVVGANTLTTGATALALCTSGPIPVIFAGGECGTNPTFDVSGDSNNFIGDLHSNSNFKWQGADLNHVTGEASYVDPYYEPSNVYTNNTWDNGFPTQQPWMEWPKSLQLDPADYAPGGPVEMMYPGQFFKYNTNGDVKITSGTPNGVHVIYGDGKFLFDADGLTKDLTLVIIPNSSDKGTIEISKSSLNITAFHDNLLFYTEFWKGGEDYPYTPPPYSDPPQCGAPAIQMSGNGNTFNGFFVSPRGMVEWNGNNNTMNGGLAGFNLKYNGNFNTMNTDPNAGEPITVLLQ